MDLFAEAEAEDKNARYQSAIIQAFEVAKRSINTDKDPYTVYWVLAKRALFDGDKKYISGIDPNLKEMAVQAGLWLRNNHPVERHLPNLKQAAIDRKQEIVFYRRHPNSPLLQSL